MSVLIAAPGMPLDEVVRRSTVELGVLREADGWALAQPRHSHTILIEHPEHGFALPEGLFTILEADEGRIVRIVASPQADLLDWSEAWQRARGLAASIEHAGWRLRGAMAGEGDVDLSVDTVIGIWIAIGWRSEMRLRRASVPTRDPAIEVPATGAVWLLSLQVEGKR